MTTDQTLREILARMSSIEEKLDSIANPLAHISAEEKGNIMADAIASGDRKRIKEAAKQINGG